MLFFSLTLLSPIISADIEAGKSKSTFCQGCHGTNGNSTSPKTPILAGQQKNYLINQLKAFKAGKRESAIMQNIVGNLEQNDIPDIAAFFASKETKGAGGDPILAKAGEQKVSMCLGCHGGSAQGRGTTPKLAGQHPAYLTVQLLNFKNKTRKNSPMNAIANTLSKQDIKEISAYLGSLK